MNGKTSTIWISGAPLDTRIREGFLHDEAEISEKDLIDTIQRCKAGQAPSRDRFPTRLYGEYFDMIIGPQPDFFSPDGFLAVTAKAAEVLLQFELGKTQLYPVTLTQNDRVTPIGGEYFLIALAETKAAFQPEQSNSEAVVEVRPGTLWQFVLDIQDGWAVVDRTALQGVDLWKDERLNGALFFSDRLAGALKDAGIDGRLRLKKTVVRDLS